MVGVCCNLVLLAHELQTKVQEANKFQTELNNLEDKYMKILAS